MLFQKAMFQIGVKTFLQLKKVKNTVSWTYVIEDFNSKGVFATFYEKKI